jgi:hypothetical protein
MSHSRRNRSIKLIPVAISLSAFVVASPAVSREMVLHILWGARVIAVECHALRNDGHDYAVGGTATLLGRDATTGKETKLVADIIVSRLQEEKEAEMDSQYLCHELRGMKESGTTADVLWSVVKSNLSRPRKAIRSVTTLRGCDENDRTGSSD